MAVRELRQDFITLIEASKRLDSMILNQADALHNARSLLKTVMPVLEATVAKDTVAFNHHKTTVASKIGSYRDRILSLREAYALFLLLRVADDEVIVAGILTQGSRVIIDA